MVTKTHRCDSAAAAVNYNASPHNPTTRSSILQLPELNGEGGWTQTSGLPSQLPAQQLPPPQRAPPGDLQITLRTDVSDLRGVVPESRCNSSCTYSCTNAPGYAKQPRTILQTCRFGTETRVITGVLHCSCLCTNSLNVHYYTFTPYTFPMCCARCCLGPRSCAQSAGAAGSR